MPDRFSRIHDEWMHDDPGDELEPTGTPTPWPDTPCVVCDRQTTYRSGLCPRCEEDAWTTG